MTDSYLDDATAHHRASEVAPEITNHVDVHDYSFVAAVLDPNTRVKLVVETHLDDDVDAGVQVVAICPGHDDVAIDLPVGDVAGIATLLISSMREAAEVTEAAWKVDVDADLAAMQKEVDALTQLVLRWQNRKDGGPRPDASGTVCAQLIADAERRAKEAAAVAAYHSVAGTPSQG
jgi:hypothetical protein